MPARSSLPHGRGSRSSTSSSRSNTRSSTTFPTAPTTCAAQPLVREFCRQHDLPYAEASLFGSYAQAVRHLHTVGAPLRPAAAE